ncbi:MAG: VOC family protein [Gammaproteobacteria bacterium]|nr:VOC family protein [Gammaproteobacteria bacterium]
MTFRHRIVQNAYYVSDLDSAIQRWHRAWGLGPFFVRRNIVLTDVQYRGRPSQLNISAAYVQAGAIQVELVTQHDDTPSAFRDVYAAGQEGFHHSAVMPPDPEQLVRDYESLGYPVATSLRTAAGRGASYVDTRKLLGHMMEIYTVSDSLTALYRDVAAAAENWDGRQLTIEVDPAR